LDEATGKWGIRVNRVELKAIDPPGSILEAIHRGRPDPQLLAHQYLQTLPKLASGDGNHTWLIPSELTPRARRVRVRVP
jgi:regulator of protease activity HflC (stomatin/prohibitin superfamily)